MNRDALLIIDTVLKEAMPGQAVAKALQELHMPKGRLIVAAVGKAAWEMAAAASQILKDRIDSGIVITKYHHSRGLLPLMTICEAGHPVPDGQSYLATQKALELTGGLTEEDEVLFLLSGGGSALFEKPLIAREEMEDVTRQLLAAGADITEINTIRKRLSAVKGGKFALHCAPAHIFTIVLSDIIGDPLDMIASGPAYPDHSTAQEADEIVRRYNLRLSEEAQRLIHQETPKSLENVETHVTGSVRELCQSAERICRKLGYDTLFLTASLNCEAREAGRFLAAVARDHQDTQKPLAILCGGETVVHLTGKGLGGRNQELVLAAAEGIAGFKNITIFSLGSDGTDGPTDAAGGIVDGESWQKLEKAGYSIPEVLRNNDAYHALKAIDALLMTGPTGTNINDLSVALIQPTDVAGLCNLNKSSIRS